MEGESSTTKNRKFESSVGAFRTSVIDAVTGWFCEKLGTGQDGEYVSKLCCLVNTEYGLIRFDAADVVPKLC